MKTFKSVLESRTSQNTLDYLSQRYKAAGDYLRPCFGAAINPSNCIGTVKTDEKHIKDEKSIRNIELPQWHDECEGWISTKKSGYYLGHQYIQVLKCVRCSELHDELFNKINKFYNKFGRVPTIIWEVNGPRIEEIKQKVVPELKVPNEIKNPYYAKITSDSYTMYDWGDDKFYTKK